MTVLPNQLNKKPSVLLDFAGTGGVPPGVKSLRTTTGTYINANGTISIAPPTVPRVEFNGDGRCEGMKTEPAAVNRFTQSGNISDAVWSKGAVTVGTTYPFGDVTGTPIMETATTAYHVLSRSLQGVVTAGSVFSATAILHHDGQANARSVVSVLIQTSSTITASAVFDLKTGEFNPGPDLNGLTTVWGCTRFASGLVIISAVVSGAATIDSTSFMAVRMSNLTSINGAPIVGSSYAGDTTKYIKVVGMQVETSAFVTSYIPTTTAVVTRAADNMSYVLPARLAQQYTLAISTTLNRFSPNAALPEFGTGLTMVDGTNTLRLVYTAANNNRFELNSTNYTQANFSTANTVNRRSAAMSFDGTAFRWSLNGSAASTAVNSAMVFATPPTIYLGTAVTTNPIIGYIRRVAIYPGATDAATLQRMTA